MIAPNDIPIHKNPEVKALYVKTHGNYEAGEQKDRNYNWKFDTKTHVFGKKEPFVENQAKACL